MSLIIANSKNPKAAMVAWYKRDPAIEQWYKIWMELIPSEDERFNDFFASLAIARSLPTGDENPDEGTLKEGANQTPHETLLEMGSLFMRGLLEMGSLFMRGKKASKGVASRAYEHLKSVFPAELESILLKPKRFDREQEDAREELRRNPPQLDRTKWPAFS